MAEVRGRRGDWSPGLERPDGWDGFSMWALKPLTEITGVLWLLSQEGEGNVHSGVLGSLHPLCFRLSVALSFGGTPGKEVLMSSVIVSSWN